ncbi:MAG TPA: ABC transporter substrate-binding protein [Capillimicrobium sp.]
MHRPLRRLAPALAAVAVAGLLGACGGDDSSTDATASSSSSEAQSLEDVTLRVGVQKDGIRAVLNRSGQLEDVPYEIEFSTFQFGPPLVEAAGADQIDLAWVGSTPPIFGAAAGSNFKIIAAVQEADSQENSILVPKESDIASLQDLAGKTVAVPKGSSAHGMLLKALERGGVDDQEVDFAFLAPADALAAFQSGSVDALTIWDPFVQQVQQSLGAEVVEAGPPDEIGVGFEIASSKALEDPLKREAIADYVGRLRKGWEWAAANQDGWAEAWSEDSGLPLEVTQEAVKHKVSEIVPVSQEILDHQQSLADLLTEKGVLPGEVTFSDIVDETVLEEG